MIIMTIIIAKTKIIKIIRLASIIITKIKPKIINGIAMIIRKTTITK